MFPAPKVGLSDGASDDFMIGVIDADHLGVHILSEQPKAKICKQPRATRPLDFRARRYIAHPLVVPFNDGRMMHLGTASLTAEVIQSTQLECEKAGGATTHWSYLRPKTATL